MNTLDIKPGNILFADNGQAKLSDFGLAYGLSHQAFSFAGYNSHLPPEVLEGVAQDAISDLYSMGITFHRLLNNMKTLDLPFADDKEWLKALKKEKYPKRNYLPHIPSQVIKIAQKAIRADRGSRYQTCLQLRQSLQKIPMAIEWSPIDKDTWSGQLGKEFFELSMYSKKTGYYIDFKRNGRKVSDKCYEKITTEMAAQDVFFKIIKETTIKI